MKTINPDELLKFEAMADEWWDPAGKFKPLHQFNPVRIQYIRDLICKQFDRDTNADQPLKGLKILDIGCGGGLMAEPFAKMGATVTAIDAVEKNIQIAKLHAQKSDISITYQTTTIEALAETKAKFDVVFALEIIEHVDNPDFFIAKTLQTLKKGGLFFGSTINRTAKSYLLAIIGAEYIMGWLPKGTHDWNKFVTPSEFISFIEAKKGMDVFDITGVGYSLLQDKFFLDKKDVKNNYILCARAI